VRELTGVPLAGRTTLRLGGPARRLVEVDEEPELVDLVRRLDRAGEPVLVLGGGSNLVVADAGFDGTVVAVGTRGMAVTGEGEHVRVVLAAGEPWDDAVARAVADGLSGVEALSGIPGRAGATPIQNVGAYGQEVADVLTGVRALDRGSGRVVELDAAACGFGYRDSALKRAPGRYLVLAVTIRLSRSATSRPVRYAELAKALDVPVGATASLADARAAVLAVRRAKGMVLDADDPDTASAGSFFTNPLLSPAEAAALPEAAPRFPQPDGRVKTSAAWLIEHAGFGRGHGHGPARISGKHTLALTNPGGATTADLLALAREIRAGVRAAYGVELAAEPVLVGCSL
jgi:UDP-N-acetylmuramate dehydrogenase